MAKQRAEYISKGWGGEEIICNTDTYCGKILTIYPGKTCSVHSHPKRETFYILEGQLELKLWSPIDQKSCSLGDPYSEFLKSFLRAWDPIILGPGDSYTLESNKIHSFTAFGSLPCRFAEFSEPHVEGEVIRHRKGD